jgi:hypothetical protein
LAEIQVNKTFKKHSHISIKNIQPHSQHSAHSPAKTKPINNVVLLGWLELQYDKLKLKYRTIM